MTTFDIFIGALLALSVHELIHLAAKEASLYVQRKKSKKRWDAMWAKLEATGLSNSDFDRDDDCDCGDCYAFSTGDNKAQVKKKPVKKAVAKKKTVKKAVPKRK